MMCIIKWDEKFFEESGLFIWIYNKGFLESSNEKLYRASLAKIYSKRNTESIKNNINYKNEREVK